MSTTTKSKRKLYAVLHPPLKAALEKTPGYHSDDGGLTVRELLRVLVELDPDDSALIGLEAEWIAGGLKADGFTVEQFVEADY